MIEVIYLEMIRRGEWHAQYGGPDLVDSATAHHQSSPDLKPFKRLNKVVIDLKERTSMTYLGKNIIELKSLNQLETIIMTVSQLDELMYFIYREGYNSESMVSRGELPYEVK